MTRTLTPEAVAIESRRKALMAARHDAIERRDWAAMDEITRRLAKLPVKGEYRMWAEEVAR